jgi:CheY-like chemotaxis protein
LVAEDNKINQQLITMLLTKAGHQIDVAENGELAVEAVRNSNYDVVLMDVQMPVLDGVQATTCIRALPSPKNAVPIIALTAHAMAGAKEEYLAADMDDYLSKPVDDVALFTKLSEVAAGMIRPAMASIDPASSANALPILGRERSADLISPDAIDPARLETIAEIMTGEELCELPERFLSSTEEYIPRLNALVRDEDFDELGREAHTIVGTAANLGALRLRELGGELREASATRDHDLVLQVVEEFTEAVGTTSAALRAWANENTAVYAA